jgi:methyl-accepting chemotaxis protein
VLIFWGVVIYAFVYFNTYNEVEQQLREKSLRITQQIGVNPLSQTLDLEPFAESQLQEAQIYIQLVDYQSGSYKRSDNLVKSGISFPIAKIHNIREEIGITKMVVEGIPFLVNQQALSLQGTNDIRGLLQVGANVSSQERLLEALRNILVFGWLVAMALAITSGLILARKSMRPLVNVIDAANQIQSGDDLSVRIQYSGPKDEIGRLIETVNNMLERTELSFRGL